MFWLLFLIVIVSDCHVRIIIDNIISTSCHVRIIIDNIISMSCPVRIIIDKSISLSLGLCRHSSFDKLSCCRNKQTNNKGGGGESIYQGVKTSRMCDLVYIATPLFTRSVYLPVF
jgi:hypothetical protein